MSHVRGCPLFTHPTQRGPDHPTDCRCDSYRRMSQDTARVVAWLRANPGSTRYEIQRALDGIHVTARMSDARAAGVEFSKVRDGKAWRFSIVEQPRQLTLDVA